MQHTNVIFSRIEFLLQLQYKFRASYLRRAQKAALRAHRTMLRIDASGLLSLQFMFEMANPNQHAFAEFLVRISIF